MLLPAFFLPFFGFGFVMYFLPSIIALARSKRDITAIVLLNFFLGWTLTAKHCMIQQGRWR